MLYRVPAARIHRKGPRAHEPFRPWSPRRWVPSRCSCRRPLSPPPPRTVPSASRSSTCRASSTRSRRRRTRRCDCRRNGSDWRRSRSRRSSSFSRSRTRAATTAAGSDQYAEWRQRYMRASIQQQAWEATAKQELDWRVKLQTREMSRRSPPPCRVRHQQPDRPGAVRPPADVTDEELEKVPAEQIGALIDRRRVIYASKNADISDAIIASLDAKYKAGGGAARRWESGTRPATRAVPTPPAPTSAATSSRRASRSAGPGTNSVDMTNDVTRMTSGICRLVILSAAKDFASLARRRKMLGSPPA